MCPADDPLTSYWDCGDRVVDVYDIICEVDFALTMATPDDCQALRADVPTGTQPVCGHHTILSGPFTRDLNKNCIYFSP